MSPALFSAGQNEFIYIYIKVALLKSTQVFFKDCVVAEILKPIRTQVNVSHLVTVEPRSLYTGFILTSQY